MNLTNISTIKSLLGKYGIRPNKRLGQHFLVDQKVLDKIIIAADLNKDDIVLEIGPGLGVLTQELAQKAGKIISVEKDETMVAILKETAKDFQNLEIVNDDILDFNLQSVDLKDGKYKIVANVPYQITSPIIRKFLTNDIRPFEMVLLVQKEMAERVAAEPGNSERGFLTVLTEFYSDREVLFGVLKDSFWPSPGVDSAVIKLKIKNNKYQVNEKEFFKIVQAGFSRKRKQLINTLSGGLRLSKEIVKQALDEAGIDLTRRAETLTIEEWVNIYQVLK